MDTGGFIKGQFDGYALYDGEKGAKKKTAAAPGLGYVDIPNMQIRKEDLNFLSKMHELIPVPHYGTISGGVNKEGIAFYNSLVVVNW
ncbi:hypothetical protein E2562_036752 [Oryza meyeriana var. granulata]|uniref:Uncharacterized protein n=1 Tax=Oryza meyeriana var. granulata TaxID=110450 RepID=A0A6G1DSU7_9ORYZ|nr:hypothetical protein E2562_036752 [Oryza meyeriana var. granulata]